MSGTCGSPMGGRRRKTSKKGKSRKLRGGMGYGFGGTIGTAGPEWNSSWGGETTKAGVPVFDSADPQRGSARRRKSRKLTKKGAKRGARRHTRKQRGGMSVAHASSGYTGTGVRGLATYEDVGGSQPFSNGVVPLA
jgi:hypothetical protein